MLGKVFKAYDIRGVYPDPLDEKVAWKVGFGVATLLLEESRAAGDGSPMGRTICVGHDMRKSSPKLRDELCRGLLDGGASVIDVGLVDTPFVYFAINHLGCAGGVQVTASHNPPQYNGFKVSRRKAKPVGEATGLSRVREIAATSDIRVRGQGTGSLEQRDLWTEYRAHVLRFAETGGKKIRVAIDASNGMAGTMVPKVFGAGGKNINGLTIDELYFDNSRGEFVHEPNPLVASNLHDLQKLVVEKGAEFGVCFDGDADRLMVIDEKGGIVGCDHLTAFLASYFLATNNGSSVVYDLRSSKAVQEDIERAGGVPVRSRVGHVFMKANLAETKGVFGGELSGHFYFRDNFYADSGAIALAVLLTAYAKAGKAMSKIIAPIARFAQSGEINFEVEDKDGALAMLEEEFGGGAQVDHLDGVTIDRWTSDGWWCNVRKSNTEPLLRLNVEAKNEGKMDEAMARITPLLGTRVDH